MLPTAVKLGRPAVVAGLIAAVLLVGAGGPGAVARPQEDAAKPAAPLPADLALVPADAAGFVHVRLADLWKNDMFAGLRKTWERAGDKALAALDRQFVPAPSSLDRATAFVLMDADTKQPQPFGVVSFSAQFAPAQLAAAYLPNAERKMVGKRAVYVDAAKGVAVTFPDNRTVLVGQAGALEAFLGRKRVADGPMAPALRLAVTRPIVAAANIAALPIPLGMLGQFPADVRPLLKANLLTVSVDLGADARLEVKAAYPDADSARDAEKSVRALVDLGRGELAKQRKELEDRLYDPKIKSPRPADELPEAVGAVFALGALGRVDDLLADPKLIARAGTDLTFAAAMPKELVAASGGFAAIAVGFALPAVQKVRGAAARASSTNNLKQILIACHAYHDAYGHWPRDITDKDGKPILSWRVAILPFIEQDNLYKQFKLDEPWDSANNKQWSGSIIKTYLSPTTPNIGNARDKDGFGLTSYKGVAGPGTIFEKGEKIKMTDVTDGLSNTIAVVESGDPIPWAKPGDFTFDPKKPLPKLATPGLADQLLAGMGDGSVRTVNLKGVTEKTLKAYLTRNGNEVIENEK